jgi:hypothetical protein
MVVTMETCHVVRVGALPGFRLFVEFDDGLSGTVDVADRLFGPVFEPLRDPEFFARVGIDEGGAVCWPNGADMAPDGLLRTRVEEQAGARD